MWIRKCACRESGLSTAGVCGGLSTQTENNNAQNSFNATYHLLQKNNFLKKTNFHNLKIKRKCSIICISLRFELDLLEGQKNWVNPAHVLGYMS